MRGLLRTMAEGVPRDTLLARIRGRRSFLIGSWDRLLLSPEPLSGLPPAPWRPDLTGCGEWRLLQREYTWVFSWMVEPLRVAMAPFFWLTELRTVAICLRYRASGREVDDGILRESLLSDPIRNLLHDAPDVVAAVRLLTKLLVPLGLASADLPDLFRQGGCGALERVLNDTSLGRLADTATDPIIKRYVMLLIDSRNLITVAKQLRWRIAVSPRLLPGGNIRPALLEERFARQDTVGIAHLAAHLGGGDQTGEPVEIEQTVRATQGRFLRDLAREPTGVGAVIDYLWRCGREARNLGLLSRLATAGSSQVEAELLS